MKHILMIMLLLSLVGCSTTPKIIETNEDALFYLSEEDVVQFSVHNDGHIRKLTTEENIELINILNETSFIGDEIEGDLLSDLSYVRMEVNGEDHTFFGNYYISKQYGTDTFRQINNSTIYNFFLNQIDLALNEKDQKLLANNKVPDENNDPEWSRIVDPFVEYYNQLDLSLFYEELDPAILERQPIDSLDRFTEIRTSDDGLFAAEYIGDHHYVKYSCYQYSDRSGCSFTPYINEKYFLEQTSLIDLNSELANQLSNVLSIQPMISYYNMGITSGITFADQKEEEVKKVQNGPQLPEPVYFKIDTFREYPISSREDFANYFRQYFIEEKAQEYIARLFDSDQANFIEKEDGVYMGINQYPSGLGGDWPTMSDHMYTYETEDAAYAYSKNWAHGGESDDPYFYYYSFKFTKTPDGLRY